MDMMTITAGELSLAQMRQLFQRRIPIRYDEQCREKVDKSYSVVQQVLAQGKTIYGVNTGFGKLVKKKIADQELSALQHNLLRSHATGVHKPFCDAIAKAIILLKINCLAQGFSGIRWQVIDLLLSLYNSDIVPMIPAKGSVGASGDLAPLSHLALLLIGEGQAVYSNEHISGAKALQILEKQPLTLQPKEGLSLINGTQVSTAILAYALLQTQYVFQAALCAGSLSWLAIHGNQSPLDTRIHQIRRQQEQQIIAESLMLLMQGTQFNPQAILQIQDPYSIRCQPQVMGTCLAAMRQVAKIVAQEINAVTDNPLVFAESQDILSGGNFHAEPIAFAADQLAWALAEMGNISERRINLLCDGGFSNLPHFLIEENGVQSGFMISHVTAAALCSENKMYAHPIGTDSIPTSGNQEDHVSMATSAAYRLLDMLQNTAYIISIELLAACQGLDFAKHNIKQTPLNQVYETIRNEISFVQQDRPLHIDIEQVQKMVLDGKFELSCLIRSNVY